MKKSNAEDHSDIPERIRNGDEKAFREIHREHYRPLIYYAHTFLYSMETAQDVVADSFCKLFVHRRRMRDLHHIREFMYNVTRNGAIDEVRKKDRQQKANSDLLHLADLSEGDPENDWLKKDLRVIEAEVLELIYREIENLPEKCGHVFKMYFFEELDTATIALRMHISPKTVLNHKANAIRNLRTHPLIRRLR